MAKGIKLKFGGAERNLRFRATTMEDFENMSGQSLQEALPKKGHGTLARLLWAGLKHEDDRLSVKKVLEQMDDYLDADGDINDLWDSVGVALMNSGLIGRQRKDEPGKAEAATS